MELDKFNYSKRKPTFKSNQKILLEGRKELNYEYKEYNEDFNPELKKKIKNDYKDQKVIKKETNSFANSINLKDFKNYSGLASPYISKKDYNTTNKKKETVSKYPNELRLSKNSKLKFEKSQKLNQVNTETSPIINNKFTIKDSSPYNKSKDNNSPYYKDLKFKKETSKINSLKDSIKSKTKKYQVSSPLAISIDFRKSNHYSKSNQDNITASPETNNYSKYNMKEYKTISIDNNNNTPDYKKHCVTNKHNRNNDENKFSNKNINNQNLQIDKSNALYKYCHNENENKNTINTISSVNSNINILNNMKNKEMNNSSKDNNTDFFIDSKEKSHSVINNIKYKVSNVGNNSYNNVNNVNNMNNYTTKHNANKTEYSEKNSYIKNIYNYKNNNKFGTTFSFKQNSSLANTIISENDSNNKERNSIKMRTTGISNNKFSIFNYIEEKDKIEKLPMIHTNSNIINVNSVYNNPTKNVYNDELEAIKKKINKAYIGNNITSSNSNSNDDGKFFSQKQSSTNSTNSNTKKKFSNNNVSNILKNTVDDTEQRPLLFLNNLENKTLDENERSKIIDYRTTRNNSTVYNNNNNNFNSIEKSFNYINTYNNNNLLKKSINKNSSTDYIPNLKSIYSNSLVNLDMHSIDEDISNSKKNEATTQSFYSSHKNNLEFNNTSHKVNNILSNYDKINSFNNKLLNTSSLLKDITPFNNKDCSDSNVTKHLTSKNLKHNNLEKRLEHIASILSPSNNITYSNYNEESNKLTPITEVNDNNNLGYNKQFNNTHHENNNNYFLQETKPLFKDNYKGFMSTYTNHIYSSNLKEEKIYDVSGLYGKNGYTNKTSSVVKEFSYFQDQNKPFKTKMEDYSRSVEGTYKNFEYAIFGLYDGHGGSDTAKYAKDSVICNLKKFFPKISAIVDEIKNINNSLIMNSENDEERNRNNFAIQIKKESELLESLKSFIRIAFINTDDDIRKSQKESGSTGVVSFIVKYELFAYKSYNDSVIRNKNQSKSKSKNISINNSLLYQNNILETEKRTLLLVANVGDSSCYLLSHNNDCKKLSIDHNCSDIIEAERVASCGGTIIYGRVMGELIVTRAFGDNKLKLFGVTAEPYINTVNLNTNKDKWLILASDGIWDVLNSYDLISNCKTAKCSEQLCRYFVKLAVTRGSKDNISCIVIKL